MLSPLPFTEAERGGQSHCFAIAIIITSARCQGTSVKRVIYCNFLRELRRTPYRRSSHSGHSAKFGSGRFSEVRRAPAQDLRASPADIGLLRVLAHFAGFDIIPVIGGVGGRCVPPPCNSFQRFSLGPGSSSTLLRRFERWRTEDLYDVGVTLCSGSEAIQVRWPLRVGLVSRRFAYVSVEGLAASRGLQEEN